MRKNGLNRDFLALPPRESYDFSVANNETMKDVAQLQNTLPLICMSLNKNNIYCVMLRSSKNADQRKQWWYRVAGYSAVTPKMLMQP